MLQLIGYPKCSTCQTIEKMLKEKGLAYAYRSIVEDVPSAQELANWKEKSGEAITKWLNTSGQKYREMKLSEKRKEMTEQELWNLLSTDGMLIKRPILITEEDKVYVGPAVKRWIEEQ